jgi:hypothetical protein
LKYLTLIPCKNGCKPDIFLLIPPNFPSHPFLIMIWQPIQIRPAHAVPENEKLFITNIKKDQPDG